MTLTETRADTVTKLIRGEMSAVETYHQALQQLAHESGARFLRDLVQQHHSAVAALREHIVSPVTQAEADPETWDSWDGAMTGVAKLLGNQAAWEALKQGEEQGIKLYEEALGDRDLSLAARDLIETRLLPAQRRHVSVLATLQKADSRS